MKKYTNLRSKSIFDFTRDTEILKQIFSEGFFEEYLENPDEMIEESKDWNLSPRIAEIIYYAKLTNNTELYNALKDEFFEDFPSAFKRKGDPYLYC